AWHRRRGRESPARVWCLPMKERFGALALLSAAALAVLAGCGSDDGDASDADEPTAVASTHSTDLPFCSDVWVADTPLPASYKGCEEDGQAVAPQRRFCSSGQKIVTYDDRFYAVLGHDVQETDSLKTDRDFQRTMAVCQG